MLQDEIVSNLEKLPEIYLKEILDFSDFLLSKVNYTYNNVDGKRGGYGARKGDFIMSDDFDEPLEDFKDYM
jgi:hypothetical protein